MIALAVPVIAVLLSFAVAMTALGSGALARQRAMTAADLAALAGVTGGCAAAHAVARAHDAVLTGCVPDGPAGDVIVRVEVGVPHALASLAALAGDEPRSISAVARAGYPGA